MEQKSKQNNSQVQKDLPILQSVKKDLQKIFLNQGLKKNIAHLIDAILAQVSTDEIMQKYQTQFTPKEYKNLQKALARAKEAINEAKQKSSQTQKVEQVIKVKELKNSQKTYLLCEPEEFELIIPQIGNTFRVTTIFSRQMTQLYLKCYYKLLGDKHERNKVLYAKLTQYVGQTKLQYYFLSKGNWGTLYDGQNNVQLSLNWCGGIGGQEYKKVFRPGELTYQLATTLATYLDKQKIQIQKIDVLYPQKILELVLSNNISCAAAQKGVILNEFTMFLKYQVKQNVSEFHTAFNEFCSKWKQNQNLIIKQKTTQN